MFAEVNVPIGDTFEITGAVRYEDYGGSVGSTINPKGAVRWEPTDWLVLRGSIGTTFSGPLAIQVSPNAVTSLAGIQAANNNFKSVDIFGNPTDLGPETAFTWNVGAVVDFLQYTHFGPPPAGSHELSEETRLLAFVLRADSPVVVVQLGPLEPIDKAVSR